MHAAGAHRVGRQAEACPRVWLSLPGRRGLALCVESEGPSRGVYKVAQSEIQLLQGAGLQVRSGNSRQDIHKPVRDRCNVFIISQTQHRQTHVVKAAEHQDICFRKMGCGSCDGGSANRSSLSIIFLIFSVVQNTCAASSRAYGMYMGSWHVCGV
jgi:hypothetical protein